MRLTDKQARELEEHRHDVEHAREELRAAIIAYNHALRDAGQFVTEVAEAARARWDSRSERWQESQKGEAAATWIDAWETAASELSSGEIDEVEPGALEELEVADEGEE